MTRYSQNDEQDVILKFFGNRIGKFLDIGAYDGMILSNTRALLELGWKGVMVEPNPHNLVPLIASVKAFASHVTVIAAAVSPEDHPALLLMDETEGRGWASTICALNAGLRIQSPVQLIVPTISPACSMSYGPFQFINIDAECMDFEILKALPRHLDGCEMICVEPNGLESREQMKKCLVDEFGLTIYHETNENIIACKQ